MYLYFVQILGNFNYDSNISLFNTDSLIITIPEGYIKLFVSPYPCDVVKSDHIEIYGTNSIYVQKSNDDILINNFERIQDILDKHSNGCFYYCPLQNFNNILLDISSLFNKIICKKNNLALFDKLKEKDKKYPILTSIVRKGMDSFDDIVQFKYIQNPYFNQLYLEFSKYVKSKEYQLFKEFHHANFRELPLIEKLSQMNNNTWVENIKNLYDILFNLNDYEKSSNFIEYYENEIKEDYDVLVYETWDKKIGIVENNKISMIQKDYFSEFNIINKYKMNPDYPVKNDIYYLDNHCIFKKTKEDIIEEKRKKFLKYFIFEFCNNSGETPINVLLDNLKNYVKKVSPSSEKLFYYKNLSPLLKSLNYKTKKKKDGTYCQNLKII